MENLQQMKLEHNKKHDPLTNKIFYDSQYDDSQISPRSEASFDSNFSDGFPAEQKKTEVKIKELKKLIKDKAITGVYLSALGVNAYTVGQVNMQNLALHGNGTYDFIGSIEDAEKVFVED